MTHFIIYAQTTPPARTWYYNKQGSKTTVNERWDEDAQGLKHGTYIQYFDNGSRAILGSYSHGKKNGQWEKTRYVRDYSNAFGISYNQFYEISTYSNDKLNGLYKNFQIFNSKDQILLDQGNYTNDMRTGFWKLGFDEKTGKFQEGNYVNGTKDGEWKNTKEYYFAEGYKTIFKNGEVIAVYDVNGIDLLEKEREKQNQEKEIAEKERLKNEQIEKMRGDFNYAMNKYQTGNMYYGDTTYLNNFLKNYPNADEEYVSKAKNALNTKSDNDAFYKCSSNDNSLYIEKLPMKKFKGYIQYQKQFPEGIHITEVKQELKKIIVENKRELLDTILISLQKRNLLNALELCEGILKYKDNIPANTPIFSIFYSLALWSNGNKDKAIEVVKPYANTLIHYSDGDRKFMDTYSDYYKSLKQSLNIENDSETYKAIRSLK
jgi:hypothetical protein